MAEYDVKELDITKGGNTYKIKGETYESKSAASGGTDLSLVTTGEKYTWNNKASSDTKNTAGTSNKTGTKMFIAAATEQSANPQTYSNSNVYIGTDNCLYSNGTKVLTAHQDISGKKNTQSAVSDPSASGNSVTFIATLSQNAQGVISPTKKTVRTMSGASSSAAGSTGLVPAPAIGDQEKFLRGNGTWAVPEGSKLWVIDFGSFTQSTAGSFTTTISGSNSDAVGIRDVHKAAVIECSNPNLFLAPILVTTGTDSVTIECDNMAAGTTTIKISFLVIGNANPLTSSEAQALDAKIGNLASLTTDNRDTVVGAINSVNSKISTSDVTSEFTFTDLINIDSSIGNRAFKNGNVIEISLVSSKSSSSSAIAISVPSKYLPSSFVCVGLVQCAQGPTPVYINPTASSPIIYSDTTVSGTIRGKLSWAIG